MVCRLWVARSLLGMSSRDTLGRHDGFGGKNRLGLLLLRLLPREQKRGR